MLSGHAIGSRVENRVSDSLHFQALRHLKTPGHPWTGVETRSIGAFLVMLLARMCADDRVGWGRAGDEIVRVDSRLDSVGDCWSDCQIGHSVLSQGHGLTDR